ncbi:DUF916 and DUF3324 domain-containing protein [Levilactobacillus namurensis]|uniref:DUF916 and DUF3324 domain-containing protein n=1 Tax=Levilactobacillus namurensis TaxID=380393 RepID=UPI0004638910|nr:DUF916 and DUF3324 domain-containing protein [Levilactobacillus namurensis]
MRKFWQGLLVLGALLVGGLTTEVPAHAAAVGYTVQVVKPKNQDDKTVGYFALRTHPNAQQTLEVIVHNQTDRPQKFNVHVTQAVTNSNGIIDYSQYDPQLDPSLKVKMRDLFAKRQQTITVPANGRVPVKVTYQMPAQRLRGCVLGGIYVIQAQPQQVKQTKAKIRLRDIFAYAVSIRLRESPHNVTPDLRMNRVGVAQVDRQNLVTANLQNFEPGILSGMSVQASVKARNGLRPILRQNQKPLGMAPNSNFNFGLPWGNHRLKAGPYTLELTAHGDGQTWHFVRNFTITSRELRKLGPTNPTKPNNWLYLLLAVIIALLLALIAYLLYRNHQARKQRQ